MILVIRGEFISATSTDHKNLHVLFIQPQKILVIRVIRGEFISATSTDHTDLHVLFIQPQKNTRDTRDTQRVYFNHIHVSHGSTRIIYSTTKNTRDTRDTRRIYFRTL